MTETHKRTITRAITYRIIVTAITAVITGLGTALILHALFTVIHYVHDRLWLKINWGKLNGDTQT